MMPITLPCDFRRHSNKFRNLAKSACLSINLFIAADLNVPVSFEVRLVAKAPFMLNPSQKYL